MTGTTQRIIALLKEYAEKSSRIGDQAHELGDQTVADSSKIAYRVATKLADALQSEATKQTEMPINVSLIFEIAGQQSLALDQHAVQREVEHLRIAILQWCLDEQQLG